MKNLFSNYLFYLYISYISYLYENLDINRYEIIENILCKIIFQIKTFFIK